jgi:hypothetical protein
MAAVAAVGLDEFFGLDEHAAGAAAGVRVKIKRQQLCHSEYLFLCL